MGLFNKWFGGKGGRNEKHIFEAGDLFYTKAGQQYSPYKLLGVDDAEETWHVLAYEPVTELPAKAAPAGWRVAIYHLPMAKESFIDPQWLASDTVHPEDLIGYHEYLRGTQSFEYCASVARDYYLSGWRLTEEKKPDQAIVAYSKAIDLVPTFFEAIDNRAFCKMEQGRWEEAMTDFRQSLEVNPGSLLAEFSMGECYLRLGQYLQARAQFEKALAIDPAHEGPKAFLQKSMPCWSKVSPKVFTHLYALSMMVTIEGTAIYTAEEFHAVIRQLLQFR